jgi:hypothetical protein
VVKEFKYYTPPEQIIQLVERARNMVLEMKATLIAVKPVRQPAESRNRPDIRKLRDPAKFLRTDGLYTPNI